MDKLKTVVLIGFDADDTLWDNEIIYKRMKFRFGELLSNHGHPDEILEMLDEIEVDNIGYYGYGLKSFALSMVETLMKLSQEYIDIKELGELITSVKEMMTTDVELIDQVEDVLEELAAKYKLMLITKGDLFEQERKIKRSGLAGYFQFIEVVGEKTEEHYSRLLEKYGFSAQQFLMVGNSLRSDILPVLRIGGRAVYIPNEHTWFHENASEDEISEFDITTVNHINTLPEYIAQIGL